MVASKKNIVPLHYDLNQFKHILLRIQMDWVTGKAYVNLLQNDLYMTFLLTSQRGQNLLYFLPIRAPDSDDEKNITFILKFYF